MDKSHSDISLSPNLPTLSASQNKRFQNFFIDLYILLTIGFAVWYFLASYYNINISVKNILIYCPFIYALYYTLFEGLIGQTLGKMLTGTKVILKNNKRPGIHLIILRTFLRFIPLDPLFYFFSRNPRGLHDKLSGTYVVDERSSLKAGIHPIIGFFLFIFDISVFILTLVVSFFIFKYLVLNLIPDVKNVKNLPETIAREIASLIPSEPNFITHKDPAYGISLTYPDSWTKVGDLDNTNQAAILFVKSKKTLFRIRKPEFAQRAEISQKTNYMNYLDISRNSNILEEEDITINNRKFHKIHSTEIVDGHKFKMLNLLTFTKNLAFNFTYASIEDEYEKSLPEAQAIIDSIKIED